METFVFTKYKSRTKIVMPELVCQCFGNTYAFSAKIGTKIAFLLKKCWHPALIKIDAEPLSTLLSIAIYNGFKQSIFPNNAEVACVKPLDKKTENKHSISIFRPISILNTYQKFTRSFQRLSGFTNKNGSFTFFSNIKKSVKYSTCAHKNDRRVVRKFKYYFFCRSAINRPFQSIWLHTTWFIYYKTLCTWFK